MGPDKKDYARRNYFIEKEFQTNFIIKFCLLIVAAGLLTISILYLLSGKSTTVSIVNSRVVVRTTADFLLPILIQTVVITTIIVGLAAIFVTLFVSHKIAGPLYRFKKILETLSQGDFSSDFHIRHFDQLQELVNAFNSMTGKIRDQLNSLKGNFSILKEKIRDLSEHEIAEHKRQTLNEIKRISEELNKIINYFKS